MQKELCVIVGVVDYAHGHFNTFENIFDDVEKAVQNYTSLVYTDEHDYIYMNKIIEYSTGYKESFSVCYWIKEFHKDIKKRRGLDVDEIFRDDDELPFWKYTYKKKGLNYEENNKNE